MKRCSPVGPGSFCRTARLGRPQPHRKKRQHSKFDKSNHLLPVDINSDDYEEFLR
jgi:hypothetical protein